MDITTSVRDVGRGVNFSKKIKMWVVMRLLYSVPLHTGGWGVYMTEVYREYFILPSNI